MPVACVFNVGTERPGLFHRSGGGNFLAGTGACEGAGTGEKRLRRRGRLGTRAGQLSDHLTV